MKPDRKPGANSKQALVFAAILIAALTLYYWNSKSAKRAERERLSAQIAKMEEERKKNAAGQKPGGLPADFISPTFAKKSAEELAKEKQNNAQIPAYVPLEGGSPAKIEFNELDANGRSKDAIIARNQDAIEKFSKLTGLKMALVPGMNFSEMEFEEGIGALIGKDALRGIEMGLFAKRGAITEDELKAFLAQDSAGIPGLEGMQNITLGQSQTLSANQGSGLGNVKYWQITGPTKSVTIALIPRTDGQGTYFASISSTSPDFDSAEEFYSQIYSGIKVSR